MQFAGKLASRDQHFITPPYAPWPKFDSDFHAENGPWHFVGSPRRPAPLPACVSGHSGTKSEKFTRPHVGPKAKPAVNALYNIASAGIAAKVHISDLDKVPTPSYFILILIHNISITTPVVSVSALDTVIRNILRLYFSKGSSNGFF